MARKPAEHSDKPAGLFQTPEIAASSTVSAMPQLQAIPEFTRVLLEQAPQAFLLVDHRTDDILYFNRQFSQLWGLSADIQRQYPLKGNDLLPYYRQTVADAEVFTYAYQRLATPECDEVINEEINCMDNRFVRLFSSPVRDTGELRGRMYVYEDITATKQREQALVKAKSEAEESALAKQRFLSAMSHEIRTPMNAVIGITHLLLQENPKPEQIENLKTLKFSSENLLVLINDILDLNKIESGKIIFEETDFNLPEIIHRIRHAFDHVAGQKGVQINIRLDEALPDMVVGDPVRLAQVLNNLIGNAVKFTNSGHVTIDVMLESEDREVINLNFAIIDTGIGISADKIDYIFENYSQAASDTTRRFGGTGLGLPITKRLLELQGSQIHVDSDLGKGSVFYFTLSFGKSYRKRPVSKPENNNLPQVDLSHVRLLLVEDNEINQLIATKFLKKLHIQPDCASNGLVALEKLRDHEYDIILMDLQMPEMDGFEAARAIRALPNAKYRHIPIIAVTAAVVADARSEALEAGITDFLAKPIDPKELCNKILQYVLNQPAQTPEPEKAVYAENKAFNYQNLLDVCGDDRQAQFQILDLARKSFKQYRINYQRALYSRDEAALSSANHFMKTLFTLLDIDELQHEIRHGEQLVNDPNLTHVQLDHSVNAVSVICNRVVKDLEQLLAREKLVG